MKTKLKHVVLASTFLFAVSAAGRSETPAQETLIFEGDICLTVDLSAPEIVDVRTFRRFSTKAARGFFLTSTFFELQLPSTKKTVSLNFRGVERTNAPGRASYYGNCQFTQGVEGFRRQLNTPNCIVVGEKTTNSEVYHSQPGSKENLRVQCDDFGSTICSVSTGVTIAPVNARVSGAISDNPPSSWKPIAEEIRNFISNHVAYLPDC